MRFCLSILFQIILSDLFRSLSDNPKQTSFRFKLFIFYDLFFVYILLWVDRTSLGWWKFIFLRVLLKILPFLYYETFYIFVAQIANKKKKQELFINYLKNRLIICNALFLYLWQTLLCNHFVIFHTQKPITFAVTYRWCFYAAGRCL